MALTILLGCGCGKTDTSPKRAQLPDSVVIDKKELTVERGGFVERRNKHSGHAMTEWMFHCYPQFTFAKQISAGYPRIKVSITIEKIKLTISCPVSMRASENSNQHTLDHEDGHLSIVRRTYENASAEARKACDQVIGEKFDGEGENEDDAISIATDKASRRLCGLYTARTVAFANEVSEDFDQASDHGFKDKPVKDAVAEAWNRFKKAHPADASFAP